MTSDVPEVLHERCIADVEALPRLRRALIAWARRVGLPEDAVDDLALATYEAMANVVDHAYPADPGVLEIKAVRPDHHITVTIADHGRWRPPPPGPRDPEGRRGRGLVLIRALADSAEVSPGPRGTTVRMRWPLPAS
jgi:serine/threonine-protein kinase RsbW